MDASQITNIAIKVGELSQKASIAFYVAIIGAITSIVCAIIAGYFKYKLSRATEQYQKQWAYIAKRSLIVDSAIETFSKMLFNKLLVSYNLDTQNANQNLFLLQKDCLVLESQMAVYGSLELAEKMANYKNTIIHTAIDEFQQKWTEITQQGRDCLLDCREYLGGSVSEEFKEFKEKLVSYLPEKADGVIANTDGLTSQSTISDETIQTRIEKLLNDIDKQKKS